MYTMSNKDNDNHLNNKQKTYRYKIHKLIENIFFIIVLTYFVKCARFNIDILMLQKQNNRYESLVMMPIRNMPTYLLSIVIVNIIILFTYY